MKWHACVTVAYSRDKIAITTGPAKVVTAILSLFYFKDKIR
jgi:hypothetical protein